jgi:hypothetical protein
MIATDLRERIHRLRRLAWMLDAAIPLPGGFRIGLDPILGLIPGLGDAIGALFSIYIVMEAAELGLPRSIVLRMAGNVALDTLIGVIPFAGDLFDAAFRANMRNIDLLERYHLDPVGTHRSSRFVIGSAAITGVLVVIGIGVLIVALVKGVARLF